MVKKRSSKQKPSNIKGITITSSSKTSNNNAIKSSSSSSSMMNYYYQNNAEIIENELHGNNKKACPCCSRLILSRKNNNNNPLSSLNATNTLNNNNNNYHHHNIEITKIIKQDWIYKKGSGNDYNKSKIWKERYAILALVKMNNNDTIAIPCLLIYWNSISINLFHPSNIIPLIQYDNNNAANAAVVIPVDYNMNYNDNDNSTNNDIDTNKNNNMLEINSYYFHIIVSSSTTTAKNNIVRTFMIHNKIERNMWVHTINQCVKNCEKNVYKYRIEKAKLQRQCNAILISSNNNDDNINIHNKKQKHHYLQSNNNKLLPPLPNSPSTYSRINRNSIKRKTTVKITNASSSRFKNDMICKEIKQ